MEKYTFKADQVLSTDEEIQEAIKQGEPVAVTQGGMILRPFARIVSYSDESIRIEDGTIMLRRANTIRTLNHKERLPYITS